MDGGVPEALMDELRAVRAELAALRAEVREAIGRAEPWTDDERDAFVASLRDAAEHSEAHGFFTAEHVCQEMTADIEAVTRERQKSGG